MDSPAPEKTPVRVTVLNQTFTLLTQGDPQRVLDTARRVDELIHDILTRSRNLDALRASVLACMHLADRVGLMEEELEALRRRIDSKTREFQEILEQVVGPA